MDAPLLSESDMMGAEDVRSQFLRYGKRIRDANVKSVQAMREMSNEYNKLLNQHTLFQRENVMLRKDFEIGRQLYLSLQQAYDNLTDSSTQTVGELEALQARYQQGVQYYIALQDAYRVLEGELSRYDRAYQILKSTTDRDRSDLEQLIENLQRVGAEETAKVVAAHTRIGELESQNTKLMKENRNAKILLGQFKDELQALKKKYDSRKSKHELTKKQNSELQTLFESLQGELNRLQNLSDAKQGEFDQRYGEALTELQNLNDTINRMTNTQDGHIILIPAPEGVRSIETLKKKMVDNGKAEIPAATIGGYSTNKSFILIDGALHMRV